MKIRKIEPRDLRSLSELYVSVFRIPPWNEHWECDWAEERLTWIFNSQSSYGYLTTINSKIIGAILGNFIPFKGEKGFEILELFVAHQYQRQGIGSKLLDRLEHELKEDGYNFITLLTAKNSETELFYLHKDYQINRKLRLLDKEF
ncbi:MAG: GNAT family N-acetyltransferase [Cyanobacteriota bacterium]|nr:GNAT family N-acetyltransferase [Cyanobacteriota bacterium]